MSPNFELIAHMLGDYYDLQADGIVDAANRFPLGAIEEQLALLGQLELAGNAVLANRIVDLTKERASLAIQRDGLIDELNKTQDEVVDIKAQRNALAATVEALRGGIKEAKEELMSENNFNGLRLIAELIVIESIAKQCLNADMLGRYREYLQDSRPDLYAAHSELNAQIANVREEWLSKSSGDEILNDVADPREFIIAKLTSERDELAAKLARYTGPMDKYQSYILEREASAIMRAPFEQSLKLSAEQLAVFRRIAENMQERAAALRRNTNEIKEGDL